MTSILLATTVLSLCWPLLASPAVAGEEQRPVRAQLERALTLLESTEAAEQDQAAEILRGLPPAQVGPALLRPLESKQDRVRRVTLRLLRDVRYDKCRGRIRDILRQDTDATVRREASHALVALHPDGAVDALTTAAVHDRDVRVRRAALLDLGTLRTPEALDSLIDQLEAQLDEGDDYLAGVTMRSLTYCTGKTLGKNVEGWRHFAEEFKERASEGDEDEQEVH
jgi:HEAT repeat protein